MNKKLLLSAALSGLMATGTLGLSSTSHAAGSKGQCHGVNGCKGKGACGALDGSHNCGGKNSCKGKGWVKMDKKSCEAKILQEAKKKGMHFKAS